MLFLFLPSLPLHPLHVQLILFSDGIHSASLPLLDLVGGSLLFLTVFGEVSVGAVHAVLASLEPLRALVDCFSIQAPLGLF